MLASIVVILFRENAFVKRFGQLNYGCPISDRAARRCLRPRRPVARRDDRDLGSARCRGRSAGA
jgi:hypothetical protein